MRRKSDDRVDRAIKLLKAGRSQVEVARLVGVSSRTIARWISDPEVQAKLGKQQGQGALVKAASGLKPSEIRSQVSEILQYRQFESQSAVELGIILRLATSSIRRALESLQDNPEELSLRLVAPLLRVVLDGSGRVSDCWARAVGLDDLLEAIEAINSEQPQIAATRSEEA